LIYCIAPVAIIGSNSSLGSIPVLNVSAGTTVVASNSNPLFPISSALPASLPYQPANIDSVPFGVIY
jgi:hypothetical protein